MIEEPFTEYELNKLKSLCETVEKAKEKILEYDFVSATHKIHLILMDLNAYVHSTEYWKNLQNKYYVSKIFCIVFEFIRIVSILLKPYLPDLCISINKFIGNEISKMKLNYCFFRIGNNQISEIYDEFTICYISSIQELKEFNLQIHDKDKGYYRIDLDYKQKIFINKVKLEKEVENKNSNRNNNKKNKK